MAKRDLAKLAVTDLGQLESPLSAGVILCKVRVALRRDNNGTAYNRVSSFDVLGIEEPECDPFAPTDTDGDASFDPAQLDTEPSGR